MAEFRDLKFRFTCPCNIRDHEKLSLLPDTELRCVEGVKMSIGSYLEKDENNVSYVWNEFLDIENHNTKRPIDYLDALLLSELKNAFKSIDFPLHLRADIRSQFYWLYSDNQEFLLVSHELLKAKDKEIRGTVEFWDYVPLEEFRLDYRQLVQWLELLDGDLWKTSPRFNETFRDLCLVDPGQRVFILEKAYRGGDVEGLGHVISALIRINMPGFAATTWVSEEERARVLERVDRMIKRAMSDSEKSRSANFISTASDGTFSRPIWIQPPGRGGSQRLRRYD